VENEVIQRVQVVRVHADFRKKHFSYRRLCPRKCHVDIYFREGGRKSGGEGKRDWEERESGERKKEQ